jgi:hypothetical protein
MKVIAVVRAGDMDAMIGKTTLPFQEPISVWHVQGESMVGAGAAT